LRKLLIVSQRVAGIDIVMIQTGAIICLEWFCSARLAEICARRFSSAKVTLDMDQVGIVAAETKPYPAMDG